MILQHIGLFATQPSIARIFSSLSPSKIDHGVFIVPLIKMLWCSGDTWTVSLRAKNLSEYRTSKKKKEKEGFPHPFHANRYYCRCKIWKFRFVFKTGDYLLFDNDNIDVTVYLRHEWKKKNTHTHTHAQFPIEEHSSLSVEREKTLEIVIVLLLSS